ncbi:MAG: flagellin lysine-N-methylase [Clostridiales bacterium]|nr:flagellin lysine-N-methylase [Clostridiales bacterium]
MKIHTLPCFDGFRCAASACGDSCCVGWEIDVDADTLDLYRQVGGSFGKRLAQNIVTEPDGTSHFRLTAGERCPFLNEENLCDIILHLGEGALCDICDQHPRFYNDYDNLQETGFGLCCEAAGRLLFSSDRPLTIRTTETEEEASDEASAETLPLLLHLREQLFGLLQDRGAPLQTRFTSMLLYAQTAQDAWDGQDLDALCDAEELAADLLPFGEAAWGEGEPSDLPAELLRFFGTLESINGEWDALLRAAVDCLALPDRPALEARFRADMAGREYEYEHLAFYFLYRYFLHAVDDGDFLSRVCLALLSVLAVRRLDFACWHQNGERFTLEDRIAVARIFSKELEYSEENMAAFLAELRDSDQFSPDGLLEALSDGPL